MDEFYSRQIDNIKISLKNYEINLISLGDLIFNLGVLLEHIKDLDVNKVNYIIDQVQQLELINSIYGFNDSPIPKEKVKEIKSIINLINEDVLEIETKLLAL